MIRSSESWPSSWEAAYWEIKELEIAGDMSEFVRARGRVTDSLKNENLERDRANPALWPC